MSNHAASEVARSLAHLIPRLTRNIAVSLEEEPSLQLSIRQLRILERLAERPHRTGELAANSMVSQPTATAAIAALEARSLVRREPDPADGRATIISLTVSGEEFFRAAQDRIHERLLSILGEGISPADAEDMRRWEERLITGMDRARALRRGDS